MPPISKGGITALIFGGISLVAIFSFLYWGRNLFGPKLARPVIVQQTSSSNRNSDQENEDEERKDPEQPSSQSRPDVIVEEDGEDEDEDEEDQSEEMQALKAAFESASSVALKYFQGQKYSISAEKYTEAIALAAKIPEAANQVSTLYNNRSAVYEKAGEYDKALADIMVVLASEPIHIKARIRKGRVLEAKGRGREALLEYTICQIIERFQNGPQMPQGPPAYLTRIEELLQSLSAKEGAAVMATLKQERGNPLPGKAYCRNFLECFPSIHGWREAFADTPRDLLVSRAQAVGAEGAALVTDSRRTCAQLKAVYELIWWDLSRGAAEAWTEALRKVEMALDAISALGDESAPEPGREVWHARFLQLRAIEFMLLADTTSALAVIRHALDLCPLPHDWEDSSSYESDGLGETLEKGSRGKTAWESALILSTILLERKADAEEVATLLKGVLGKEKGGAESGTLDEALRIAWAEVHLASFATRKDMKGWYQQGASKAAMIHIERALAATESSVSPRIIAVRLIALQKAVSVTVTVAAMERAQLGYQQPPSAEDLENARRWLREANRLAQSQQKSFSNSSSLCTVLQLEAEVVLASGDPDAAILLCDQAVLLADSDDSVPLVNKGNIMLQKVMAESQSAQEAGNTYGMKSTLEAGMENVKNVFNEALRVEPNGLEALAQMGQLLSIAGDLQGALDVLTRAVKSVRSTEEAIELTQMRIATELQLEALKELQKLQK